MLLQLLSRGLAVKFVKFCIVGLSGLLVDFGITYLCKEHIKIQKYVSNAIGFTIASSTNYFLNRIWTFQSQNSAIAWEYSKFIIVSLIGLGINTLILWILVSMFRKQFYWSKLGAIIIVTIWNFIANYLFTFTQ